MAGHVCVHGAATAWHAVALRQGHAVAVTGQTRLCNNSGVDDVIAAKRTRCGGATFGLVSKSVWLPVHEAGRMV